MGLLKHLLFWPVTGPLFLTRFSMGKVRDTARDELTDPTPIREELMALQLELELGEIDVDEYARREEALMARLREVREWRERFGMGVRGGPVRMAEEGAGSSGDAEGSSTVETEGEWATDSGNGSEGGSTPGPSSS